MSIDDKQFFTVGMLTELTAHPEKRFKRIDDDLVIRIGEDGSYQWESGYRRIKPIDRWVETDIWKAAIFMEAIEAYHKGKDIKSIIGNREWEYYADTNHRGIGACGGGYVLNVSTSEILNGKWFVRER